MATFKTHLDGLHHGDVSYPVMDGVVDIAVEHLPLFARLWKWPIQGIGCPWLDSTFRRTDSMFTCTTTSQRYNKPFNHSCRALFPDWALKTLRPR